MADLIEGLVIAHLGKGLAVKSGDKTLLCQTRRQLGTVAVGDRVLWQKTAPDQGRVMQILPRQSVLMRPLRNGKTRPVAANIDRVFIVFAVQPACDFLLIDQYLVVCENNGIEAILLWNKIDLFDEKKYPAMLNELSVYTRLGYVLLKLSVLEKTGLAELKQRLRNRTNLLTGQSGVGKSSISNTLLPGQPLKTNTLSKGTGHGRHTTTAATLYPLAEGGALIDSPGVAIFGLAGISEAQLTWGYREFQPLLSQCQFNNCRHVNDKGCAIRAAVERGTISANRYQRFLKLREKMALAG